MVIIKVLFINERIINVSKFQFREPRLMKNGVTQDHHF